MHRKMYPGYPLTEGRDHVELSNSRQSRVPNYQYLAVWVWESADDARGWWGWNCVCLCETVEHVYTLYRPQSTAIVGLHSKPVTPWKRNNKDDDISFYNKSRWKGVWSKKTEHWNFLLSCLLYQYVVTEGIGTIDDRSQRSKDIATQSDWRSETFRSHCI